MAEGYINNDLYNIDTQTINYLNGTIVVTLKKIAGIMVLASFEGNQDTVAAETIIGTIPTGYIPASNTSCYFGESGYVRFSTDGNIKTSKPNAWSTGSGVYSLR